MTNAALESRPSLVAGIANADLAATILRVALGILFLAHAWLKLVIFTPAGTVGFFESLGFPGFLAYLVIAAELASGLMQGSLVKINSGGSPGSGSGASPAGPKAPREAAVAEPVKPQPDDVSKTGIGQ